MIAVLPIDKWTKVDTGRGDTRMGPPQHPTRPGPALFQPEILPRLQGMSYSATARATGLSRRHTKLIATGQAIPHPMHWPALQSAGQRRSS